ncbi:hypothetical protein ACGYK6_16390 [Sulfitobacter sp. 1A15333]|uniref:hypothetical protein n=1 Tax=Sulfitobacter sp. 1A15333 TaxID=3368570 RepID=UPI003745D802
MTDIVDHDGTSLFVDDFTHTTHDADGTSINVFKTNGNLWFSGPDVMMAMGFREEGAGGGYARRLSRIDHPDIIKIADTPFRFADGRRNRGSLISPRAVHRFAEGKVRNFNPIKAYAFLQWMKEALLADGDEETWSPARPPPTSSEPVFRDVIKVTDENEYGEALDPLRPMGDYHGLGHLGPLLLDEIEFPVDGHGIFNLRQPAEIPDGLIIDDDDDFLPLKPWLKAAV